ncbi:MAG: hypothetical protein ABEJ99_03040 [Candidatus Nanohaloarchaea archaeon]
MVEINLYNEDAPGYDDIAGMLESRGFRFNRLEESSHRELYSEDVVLGIYREEMDHEIIFEGEDIETAIANLKPSDDGAWLSKS